MTAATRRSFPRFTRPAALGVAAAVVLAVGTATVQAQKPGASYAERSSVFNPHSSAPVAGKAAGALQRSEAPLVRVRPENHSKYFSDERPGQYKNKSLPAKRAVRGRRNSVSAKASTRTFRGGGGGGMGMGGGGMSMPGMSRIQGMNPGLMMGMGRRGRNPAGTYGGARPIAPDPHGGK